MRKGSENKKKERKKNETIETAVIRFGNGSITIENASKGIVYSIYKVFDAKVNAEGTSVAYSTKNFVDNPYFEKDS